MIESDLRRHLQKGLESQNCLVIKLPDLAKAMIKPCDLILGINRQIHLVEIKLRKTKAQRGLVGETIVVSRSDFRPHQLPTLLEVHEKGQAHSWIAVCVAAESMGRIVAKRAWLLPAMVFKSEATTHLTIGELDNHLTGGTELIWVKNIGWTVSWLPDPA